MNWETVASIVGGLAVVGLIVFLVLHDPRNTKVRLGVFLERYTNDNHKEGDEDGS